MAKTTYDTVRNKMQKINGAKRLTTQAIKSEESFGKNKQINKKEACHAIYIRRWLTFLVKSKIVNI